ncbi:MAG TPA: hypothetical protein GYA07_07195 [Verrucomicrobia bacterium]|nr:hypothetical protein [Verrucomicrobiota bacterium]HOP98274.1 SBBP repeat-containing protein [Verrucomicrobiota bacterium]HPU56085.1 SBBP repeat-containing protein [Verrucomicrobiota bacterium]
MRNLSVALGACVLAAGSVFGVGLTRPLYFERNLGQADEAHPYIARGGNCAVLLAADSVTLFLDAADSKRGASRRTIRIVFENANASAPMHGVEPVPGKANYLLGAPSEWRTGIPLYGRVQVENIYPGIHLVYYADAAGRLEYDFHVQPGADPGQIRLRVEGADRLKITDSGDLVLQVGGAQIRQHRPVVYQEGEERKQIEGRYRRIGHNRVAFELANYDRSRALVIDPVLTFSTYLGGAKADYAHAVAVDPAGNIYVAGETLSKDLPGVSGFQTRYGGGIGPFGDAFVAKYDAVSNQLVYLTYFGGRTDDGAMAIAVDATGVAYITGFTDSRDFPLVPTNNPISPKLSDFGRNNNAFRVHPVNAFVTALTPDGAGLVYSLILGGNRRDGGFGIAVSGPDVYVAGLTESTNFIPRPVDFGGFQTNIGGRTDAFVVRLTHGTNCVFSTYLGGEQMDYAQSLALGPSGNVLVTGVTSSTNFPILNPLTFVQGTNLVTADRLNGTGRRSPRTDAFVTELTADGSALVYSTYLGGISDDVGMDIAVDGDGNASVTGYTLSSGFPVVNSALPAVSNFFQHPFVARIGPGGGSNLLFSTHFGSFRPAQGLGVAVDAAGNTYVAGVGNVRDFFPENSFTDLRSTNAVSRSGRNANDVFVAVWDASGALTTNSFLLGGSRNDQPNDIAVDGSAIYVVGQTTSSDLPLAGDPPQTLLGNRKKSRMSDAFIQKIIP